MLHSPRPQRYQTAEVVLQNDIYSSHEESSSFTKTVTLNPEVVQSVRALECQGSGHDFNTEQTHLFC